MRAPKFWKKANLFAELLLPLSTLYFLMVLFGKRRAKARSFKKPVICVGNVTAGGSGKTPVALSVAALLKPQYKSLAFASRGYQGELEGPVKVDLKKHTAKEVGDEPLLLAKAAPCWVAKSRGSGIQAAIDGSNANLVIMDDGLQNFTVSKDVSLLVIDGLFGLGNGYMIPAGPMRERFKDALSRCDAVILIGEDTHNVTALIGDKKPLFKAAIKPLAPLPSKKETYLAFAGIGHPEKFLRTLMDLSYKLVDFRTFEDHHSYTEEDYQSLLRLAKAEDAALITTEKDGLNLPKSALKHVKMLKIGLAWEDEKSFKAFLLDALKGT